MKHNLFTKALAVILTLALLIPGGSMLASAECDHDFSVKKVITEPTCTTGGVAHYLCSKCEQDEGIDYHSDPLGHNGVWKIEQDATEDHPGVKSFVCTRCGDVLPDPDDESKTSTQEFELHEHCFDADIGIGYQRILTPATCTTNGEMGTFCGICSALFAVETIEAEGHQNDQLTDYLTTADTTLKDYFGCHNVVTVQPTCKDKGSVTFLCDVCGEPIRTYDLHPIGHHNDCWDEMTDGGYDPEDYIGCANVETIPATCTKDGEIRFLCDDCGVVMITRPIEATGHHNAQLADYLTSEYGLEDYIGYTNVVVTTEPTCTKNGVVSFLCDECGEVVRSYPLEKAGHTFGYEQAIVDATCVTKGRMGVYCANCGELYETKEIEPLGHDWGEWYINGNGTHSRGCSRCMYLETANCKYSAIVTEPTCVEGGYTTYVCDICGYTYVDKYTDPLGHDWGEWIADEDADTHTRTCDRCGEKETEEHCFGEWVYNHDAKFCCNGTKSMTCEVCGKVVTEKAKFTAWIWHVFYPIILWVGTIVHKSVFLASLSWFLPWLNIIPQI